MPDLFKRVLLGAVVFVAIDAVWLGLVMKQFYSDQLGSLARRSGASLAPIWTPAVLFYLLIALGLVVFVLPRARGAGLPVVFAFGWLFGLVAYGTYDLTNYSTLAGWPLTMTIVDLVWGGIVCGITSVVLSLV